MQKQLSVLAIAAALTLGVAGLAQAENSSVNTSRQNATSGNGGHGVPDTLGGSQSRVPDTLGGSSGNTREKGNGYGSSARENNKSTNGSEGDAAKIPDTLGDTNGNGTPTQHRR